MGNETSRLQDVRMEELETTIMKNAEEIRSYSTSFVNMKNDVARQMEEMRTELTELQDRQREQKLHQDTVDHQVENLALDIRRMKDRIEGLQKKFQQLSKDHENSKSLQPSLITEALSQETEKWNFNNNDLNRKYAEMRSYFTDLIESCKNNNSDIEDLSEKFKKLQAHDSGVIMPCRCPNSNGSVTFLGAEVSTEDLTGHRIPSEKSCYDANLIKIKRAIKVMKEQIKVDEELSTAEKTNEQVVECDRVI